jgi:hypothetical protein
LARISYKFLRQDCRGLKTLRGWRQPKVAERLDWPKNFKVVSALESA